MSFRLIAKSIFDNPGNSGHRLSRCLRAVSWQFRKHVIRRAELLRLPNGLLFKAYPDCRVSSALIYAAWPEYHELKFLRGVLEPGQIVIDVGANVGHISLLVADIVGLDNLYTFEPAPVSSKRLLENWRLNRIPEDHHYQCALGRNSGVAYIVDSRTPLTTNSVAEIPPKSGSVKVQMCCLDQFREIWRDRIVGLLKIDVEGSECDVLHGATRLLREGRPQYIMFESLFGELDPRIELVLTQCGYATFQLDSRGCPDPQSHRAQNLFSVSNEKLATARLPSSLSSTQEVGMPPGKIMQKSVTHTGYDRDRHSK